MKLSGIIDFLLMYRIRRCIYCRKIKWCEYRYFAYGIEVEDIFNPDIKGIDGYFCNNCKMLPIEDVFTKLKNRQYSLSKTSYAMGRNIIKEAKNDIKKC